MQLQKRYSTSSSSSPFKSPLKYTSVSQQPTPPSSSSSISSSSSSSGSNASRSICYWISLVTTISVIVIIGTIFVTNDDIPSLISLRSGDSGSGKIKIDRFEACTWYDGDPVIYNLYTKIGVNYEGNHWFHMAENFMVYHSILRKSYQLSNASVVYYNLYEKSKLEELNGVTKFILLLSTVSPFYINYSGYNSDNKTIAIPQPRTSSDALIKGSRGGRSRRKYNSYPSEVSISKVLKQKQYPVSAAINTAVFTYLNSDNAFKRLTYGDAILLPRVIDDMVVSNVSSSVKVTDKFIHSQIQSDIFQSSNTFIGNSNHSSSSSSSSSSSKNVCVRYLGSIGGKWPTVQRGHWFPNHDDIDSFRDKIKAICPIDNTLMMKYKKKKQYKLLIYQRDLSRKLANEEEAIQMIKGKLDDKLWEIVVVNHARDGAPCDMAHMLHNVDVLLSPHGFQFMLLMFLPRPSIIFEVFPYKYYKIGYTAYSSEYGVIHSGVMSPSITWYMKAILSMVTTTTCMSIKECRGHARSVDVILTQHGVNILSDVIADNISKLVDQPSSRDFLYY